MALTMMQLLIVSNEERKRKREKEKRTSVQYSITQIDIDKAIVETVFCSSFFFSPSCVRIQTNELNFNEERKQTSNCERI